MKDLRIITLILLFCVNLFFMGCVSQSINNQKININIGVLKGPTGLGMLKLIQDNENQDLSDRRNINIYDNPSEVVAKISNGEIDIATLPTNMAAVLYQKNNHNIKILNLNTLGTLSIISRNDEIKSIFDLKGKTIYVSGQGYTPEYVLNYILKQNEILQEEVNIEYTSEHIELTSLILSNKISIALLPEPFATQVTMKDKTLKKVIDLTKEWDKVSNRKSLLTMGCLISTKGFINNNKEALDAFLDDYKVSVAFIDSNIEEVARLSEKYDIMPYETSKIAIPNCNIVYIDSSDMINKTREFLQVMYQYNPKSVGGKLPDEDFYYQR